LQDIEGIEPILPRGNNEGDESKSDDDYEFE